MPTGTPGTTKTIETSRHWSAYRRDGKNQCKVRLYTDKAASLAELSRMNTALERGQAGLTDPRQDHLDRPTVEHFAEFLPVMWSRGKSAKDKARKEMILRAFARDVPTLADLTHEAVDRYLASVGGSAGTLKKHLSAISVWGAWLLKKERQASNPLDRGDVPPVVRKPKSGAPSPPGRSSNCSMRPARGR